MVLLHHLLFAVLLIVHYSSQDCVYLEQPEPVSASFRSLQFTLIQIEIKHIVETVALFLNLISITHYSSLSILQKFRVYLCFD
jgi:hypothetical protein